MRKGSTAGGVCRAAVRASGLRYREGAATPRSSGTPSASRACWSTRPRCNTIGELANGNRLAGTKGHDASSLYVGVNSAFAGLKVSQHEFDYDLDFLADWKQPKLDITTRGKRRSFNPGIAGASFEFGGDFGSMFRTESKSTDITAPVWAADVRYPAGPTANGNTSGCEVVGLRRHAGRRDRGRPARHLPVRDEVPARRPGRRRRDADLQRGQRPGAPRSHAPALVQRRRPHDAVRGGHGRDRHRPGQRRPEGPHRPDRPDPDGLAARHLSDPERHRGDQDRRPEQGDRGRRPPRQRGHGVRASTTTGPARRRCSRWPSTSTR